MTDLDVASAQSRFLPIAQAHRRSLYRRGSWLSLLVGLLIAGICIDIMTGPAAVPLTDLFRALLGSSGQDVTMQVILWQVRIPTALLAALVGAGLSLAGAEMQTILSNSLASPFTLGVSSAASFGAALAIVLGITIPWIPPSAAVTINAFVMAFVAVALIQMFATTQQGAAPLVLFGIAMVFGFNALVAVIQFIAPADSLQQLIFWTMGSLARADTTSVTILAIALAVLFPFSMRAAWSLTLISLGEERAQSLGINVRRLRFGCLLRASLLAALCVALTGTIGFVGLVGPHIARLLVGEDHRFYLPAALLCGAVVMSFASIAAKMILPGVLLPVGIVTSLIGLPCFIALLMIRRRTA